MNTIHIITDSEAAAMLEKVLKEQESEEQNEILLLKDSLNTGLLRSDDLPFSQLRTSYIEQINETALKSPVDDLERIMSVSTRLSNGEDAKLCFWMAANAADVCAFYWLLHYLKKHKGKLSVINISGLPFINEDGQLFYADILSQLPEKEIIKSLRLMRTITPSEWETLQDEWKKLREENAALRILKEGRTLQSVSEDYFDTTLQKLSHKTTRRISTIIHQARQQLKYQVSVSFLQYRLKVLEAEGQINQSKNEVSSSENLTTNKEG